VNVGSIARDLKVSTVNGDISVKGSRGQVDMSTTNGDINADLYSMAGKVKFATTNGSIEVTIPETLNAALNMRTVNGDLDFGLPATITKKSKREITATLGQGGSPIEIETTNGSISVKPGGAP